MELGTIEEAELIVDQIASNKIPPPNKAQSLVIIRQMVRLATRVTELEKERDEADRRAGAAERAYKSYREAQERENERLKALCDQLAHSLQCLFETFGSDGSSSKALAAWRNRS